MSFAMGLDACDAQVVFTALTILFRNVSPSIKRQLDSIASMHRAETDTCMWVSERVTTAEDLQPVMASASSAVIEHALLIFPKHASSI